MGSFVVLLMAVGAGCTPSDTPDPGPAYKSDLMPAVKVLERPAWYLGLAFVDESTFVTQDGGDGTAGDGRILAVSRDGEEHVVHVSAVQECGYRSLGAIQSFKTGNFLVPEDCAAEGSFAEEHSVLAVDASTGLAAKVVVVPGLAPRVTLSEDGSRGYVSFGARICQGLGRIEAGELQPIDLVIRTAAGSFNLADQVRDPLQDCDSTGRADLPVLESNGERLAFFTSVRSVGASGMGRLDVPWELQIWDQAGVPTMLLDGVESPQSLGWSPDGSQLVFGGAYRGDRGTFLLDLQSPAVTRISEDTASFVAWHGDGRSVFIIPDVTEPGFPPRSVIVQIDVSGTK